MNNVFHFQNELLNEGGVAGHLSHVYDNYTLTFQKIKQIIDLASAGKLEGTEKTDGFNIFMSFRDGQARCARNKTDIKKGGMTLGELMRRPFAGGDKVKSVFVEAFETFEKAVYALKPEDVQKIFGPQGNIYYNIEIMGPAAENVISYDTFVLTVHRSGHGYFDRETGVINPDVDVEENSEYLNSVIDRMQNGISDNRFNIERTAIINLQKLSDDSYANNAKLRIDKELRKYGLNDSATIQDYLYANIRSTLEASGNFKKYGEFFLDLAVNSVLGIKSLRDIPKGTPKPVRSFMSNYGRSKKNAREILKKAIWPIEDIIHDFSIQMLSGLESAYILDNQSQIDNLKKEVSAAIKAIQGYDGPEAEQAQDILKKQLSKIKHIDNIDTVVEGFVFEFEGYLYKFTGNFAPINQLLGLYKWGRGSVPALKPTHSDGEIEEAVIGMTAADAMSAVPDAPETATSGPKGRQPAHAIIPGGYKPPHAGHYAMVKQIADMKRANGEFLVKEVHVLISPKPRESNFNNKTTQVTAEDSLRIWQIYAANDPRIKPQISANPSPVRATYEFMEQLEPNSIMVVATSEKDKNDSRFAKLQDWSDKHGYGITVKTVVVDEFGENVSGTAMRKYIAQGDEESFKLNLPSHLSAQLQQQVWDIVAPNDVENIEIQENRRKDVRYKRRKAYERIKGKKALQEIDQKYVEVVDDFMDNTDQVWGRSLSFNDLFKGKNRLIVPMPAELQGPIKEIQEFLTKIGWELDLHTGNVSREYAYTIPAGPKQGETIQKQEAISLGKFLKKFEKSLEDFESSKEKSAELIAKQLKVLESTGEINKFVDYIFEKYVNDSLVKSVWLNTVRASNRDEKDIAPEEEKDMQKNFKNLLKKYFAFAIQVYLRYTASNEPPSAPESRTIDLEGINRLLGEAVFTPKGLSSFNYNHINAAMYGAQTNIISRYPEEVHNRAKSFEPIYVAFRDIAARAITPADATPYVDAWAPTVAFWQSNLIVDIIEYYDTINKSFDNTKKLGDKLASNVDTDNLDISQFRYFFDDLHDKRKLKRWQEFWNTESSKYRENPEYGKEAKYSIVVSRHPIDVLRMSDFDGMSSCHSAGQSYFRCAMAEAHGHGPIAYIVENKQFASLENKFDENVDEFMDMDSGFQTEEIFVDYDRQVAGLAPVSRLRMRKFVKDDPSRVDAGEEAYELAMPETRIYGNKIPYFYETLRDWLYENQVTKILQKEGYQNEEELEEEKLDTRKWRRYGGTYADTNEGQLWSKFFGDNWYQGRYYGRSVQDDAETDAIGNEMEVELEQFVEDAEYLLNRLDNIRTNVDYEYYDDDEWYITLQFHFDLTAEVFHEELGMGYEEFEVEFPTRESNYRVRRDFAGIIDDILDDMWIYGESEMHWDYIPGKGYSEKVIISFNPGNLHTPDEYMEFIQDELEGLDNNWPDFIEEVFDRMTDEGYIYMTRGNKDHNADAWTRFVAQMPIDHFEVQKERHNFIFTSLIDFGDMISLPTSMGYDPSFKSVTAPINGKNYGMIKKIFLDLLNYVFAYYDGTIEAEYDKKQTKLDLQENSYSSLETSLQSDWNVELDFLTDWGNLYRNQGRGPSGKGMAWKGGGRFGMSSTYDSNNLNITTSAWNKKIDIAIKDGKLKIDSKAPRTIPLIGKLSINVDKNSFYRKPEAIKKKLKFLIWLDKQKIKPFEDLGHKFLQYLNGTSLYTLFNNVLPKAEEIIGDKERLLQYFNEDGKWIDNPDDENSQTKLLLGLYGLFSDMPFSNKTLPMSYTKLKDTVEFFKSGGGFHNKETDAYFYESKFKDSIKGGIADLKRPEDFDPTELKRGTRVEFEHTDSVEKAMEIAMDHLAEDPNYYKKLSSIHEGYLPPPGGNYYNIDSKQPNTTLETVHKKWTKGMKLRRDDIYYFPIDQVYAYREYDWSVADFRGMHSDPQYFNKLQHSLLKNGWDKSEPAVIQLGKNGCGKLGEGNHRIAIAIQHKKRFNKIPVRILFQDDIYSDHGKVHCVEKLEEISAAGGGAVMGAPTDKWLEKKEYKF